MREMDSNTDINEVIRSLVETTVDDRMRQLTLTPELISVAETRAILGGTESPLDKATVLGLARNADTNGFPAVWLSSRTLKIDKLRLAQWCANGGLGVKV